MAQKVTISLTDDTDGSEAAETISFALDGATYEIDLSEKNASKLRGALAPFVGYARRTSGPKRVKASGGSEMRQARQWAKDNGIDVPDRGRVPSEVMEKFKAATNDAQRKSNH